MGPRRLLILGGTDYQVTAIRYAKRQGHHVITCDYLPDNPGHRLADEYHNVSTTDQAGVLALAERLRIDGILAYASDPAAPTAAYVAERLGLPGNPYESVLVLTHKDLFREFQHAHGFNAPQFRSAATLDDARGGFEQLRPPVVLKPVDSSGSKGVRILHSADKIAPAFDAAMAFSRAKRVILEEHVSAGRYQVAGDGFLENGVLTFRCFANEHFKPGHPTLPVGESFPSVESAEIQAAIHSEAQRLLTLLGMRSGGLNFDVRVDPAARLFLMELGPRAGGFLLPDIIELATGVDLAGRAVDTALGIDHPPLTMQPVRQFVSSYCLHSLTPGTFQGVEFSDEIRPHLIETRVFAPTGSAVHSFDGLNRVLGMNLLRYDSMDQTLSLMQSMERHIRVKVSPPD